MKFVCNSLKQSFVTTFFSKKCRKSDFDLHPDFHCSRIITIKSIGLVPKILCYDLLDFFWSKVFHIYVGNLTKFRDRSKKLFGNRGTLLSHLSNTQKVPGSIPGENMYTFWMPPIPEDIFSNCFLHPRSSQVCYLYCACFIVGFPRIFGVP